MKMPISQRFRRFVLSNAGVVLLACLLPDIGFSANIIHLDKEGFQLTYDCDNRTALRYDYSLSIDTGSAKRPTTYDLDSDLPSGCGGQFRTASYSSIEPGWDRGHLVTSNHMDASSTWMKRANLMSNIVPQASSFNQGIWLEAENVAECYRDVAPLRVVGGVVYNDESNDYFLASHGVRTPDFFWKTIITIEPATGESKTISWYIPNSDDLSDLDSYIVSIFDLEELIGVSMVNINASDLTKTMKPTHTWALPSHCNKG